MDIDLIDQMDYELDLNDRVVIATGKKKLNLLNGKNIKCLITADVASAVEKLEFPVVEIEKDSLENIDGIKAVKIDYIEKRLGEAKKAGLIGWIRDYRKRKD
jgi:hypothetical protein